MSAFGIGAMIGGQALGGIVRGIGAVKEEKKKKKAKQKLQAQIAALRAEIQPTAEQLALAYQPGGFYERALIGRAFGEGESARRAGLDVSRRVAAGQGGRGAGIYARPLTGGYAPTIGQAYTLAPVSSAAKRAGLELTTRGLDISRMQFPEFRNQLAGFGEAIRSAGQTYYEYEQIER